MPALSSLPIPEQPPGLPVTLTVEVKGATALLYVDPAAPPPPPPTGKDAAAVPAAPTAFVTIKFPGEAEELKTETATAADDGTFAFNFSRPLERVADVPLLQSLLGAAAVVTVFNAAAKTKDAKGKDVVAPVAVGTLRLDLTPLVKGAGAVGGESLALEPTPVAEGAPPLLAPGASLSLRVTPTSPLVTPEEAALAAVATVRCVSLSPAPPAMVASSAASGDPFTVAAVVHIAGRVAVCAEGALREDAASPGAVGIAWDAAASPLYLSSREVTWLHAAVTAGLPLSLEVGRLVKPGRAAEISDPAYGAYRAAAAVLLPALLEPGRAAAGGVFPLDRLPGPAVSPLVREKPQPKAKPIVEEEAETCPWAAVGASLTLEVTLSRPLRAAWEAPPRPLLAVGDLVPRRPPPAAPVETLAATKAFRAQVQLAASALAAEYARLFGEVPSGSSEADAASRRRSLVFELNRSGKYLALKEALKGAAVAVVAEKYRRGPAEATKAGLESLYDDLYVYLTEEMHAALAGAASPAAARAAAAAGGAGAAAESAATLSRLRSLADEAEVNDDFASAAKHHADRAVAAPGDPGVWHDYGTFHLRRGAPAVGQAEECLREAVALDPSHLPSLLALAGLMATTGQLDAAEAFATAAKDAAPESSLAWGMLGLVMDAQGKATHTANCEYEARRLGAGAAEGATDAARAAGTSLSDCFLHLSLLLLDLHLPVLARAALSRVASPSAVDALLCSSRAASLLGDTATALALLEEARAADTAGGKPPSSAAVPAMAGAVHLARGDAGAAIVAYEDALALSPGPCPLDVYLRLGGLYASRGDHSDAKRVYLSACAGHPRSSAWLGAGTACLRLGELQAAEEALAEANVLDCASSRVWGTLALVALLAGREAEAGAAMSQALKLGLSDAGLFGEVGALYVERGRYRHAESALRHAVASPGGDTPTTRRLLGDALREQGEGEAAEEQYAVAEAAERAAAAETEAAAAAAAAVAEAESAAAAEAEAEAEAATAEAEAAAA